MHHRVSTERERLSRIRFIVLLMYLLNPVNRRRNLSNCCLYVYSTTSIGRIRRIRSINLNDTWHYVFVRESFMTSKQYVCTMQSFQCDLNCTHERPIGLVGRHLNLIFEMMVIGGRIYDTRVTVLLIQKEELISQAFRLKSCALHSASGCLKAPLLNEFVVRSTHHTLVAL
uniref:Putative secreted protein n=1 Tax=Anopheles darlingi TaxID=43151 RepID=A0A2M4DQS2_ANODA